MPATVAAEAGVDPAAEHPARIVWTLAWPAVALSALQTVNSLLDSYFVQHLSAPNLTALGSATNILFLFISLSFAMSVSSTALVSRAFGAKDRPGYLEANQKCLGTAVIAGVVFAALSLPGTWLASQYLLPADAVEARQHMRDYLSIFSLGLPAFFIVQTLAGSLRGTGDTKSPMVISSIQIAVHIGLNLFLINGRQSVFGLVVPGLGWGLKGAACALVTSAWIAAIVYVAWASRTALGSCWRCSWPGLAWVKRILSIAVPAAMMAVVRVSSLMAFTRILTAVPQAEAAIGAMRPGFSIESLCFMPAFGLAIAASALVGQSLGMKRPDRAERLAWTASHHAAFVSLVTSALLFVFAKPVVDAVMPNQPVVSHFAVQYLRYVCVTEVLMGYAMVFIGAMQGAGDTVRPLLTTLVCMWGIRVPLAAVLALAMKLGSDGAWLAMSLTQGLQGIVAGYFFRQGAWKLRQV